MRGIGFWETAAQNFDDDGWYLNFRMPKAAFYRLCNDLSPLIHPQSTTMKSPVPLDKRVGITLYKLASNVEFHDVANLFGVGVSTACDIFWEVCKALCQMKKKYVTRPKNEADIQAIIDDFERKSGFPMCGGALDGTHIPIIAPSAYHTDYYNRKGWYSVLLQGLVDSNYRFLDFDVGWPGKCHDSFVFESSYLYTKLENGTFFPNVKRMINGVEIPVLIVADSAYSLSETIMKPYPEGTATASQRCFNECLSRARIHVEHAFGRLKGRWRTLMKRNDSKTSNLKYIVIACIVLHNFCESLNLQCNTPPRTETLEQPQEEVNNAIQMEVGQNNGEHIRMALERFINQLP